MNVIVYGLVGHASSVNLPLEALELDELETGREFAFKGKLYEIRSLTHGPDAIQMNVVMVLDHV